MTKVRGWVYCSMGASPSGKTWSVVWSTRPTVGDWPTFYLCLPVLRKEGDRRVSHCVVLSRA
jgi:hypothetical protein